MNEFWFCVFKSISLTINDCAVVHYILVSCLFIWTHTDLLSLGLDNGGPRSKAEALLSMYGAAIIMPCSNSLCSHWASSRCWITFLSQAFRPCQIFRMTPRKLLRCVATFSVGNFWKKSIFCAFLGLKNEFLTSLKVWFDI